VAAIQSANLALRFLLELSALGALGYWGFRAAEGMAARIVLAVGAPLLAAIVWGLFVAPQAAVPVPQPVHLLLQAAVFGFAAAGLAASGHPGLGAALAVVALANWALMQLWGQ
jgi:hypothetical protein